MSPKSKRLPDSELEVMLAIWQAGGPIHTGEIAQRLRGANDWKTQTVQMLLSRLVDKGYLRCEKLGRLNYYTPLVSGEIYRAEETRTLLERMYDGSPSQLMAALVQSGLEETELVRLRALLKEEILHD